MEQQPPAEVRLEEILEKLLAKEERVSGAITIPKRKSLGAFPRLFSLGLHIWKDKQEVEQDLKDALEIQAFLLADFNRLLHAYNLPTHPTAQRIPALLAYWISFEEREIEKTGIEAAMHLARNMAHELENFQRTYANESFIDVITLLKSQIQIWEIKLSPSKRQLAFFKEKFRQFQSLESLIRRLRAIILYYEVDGAINEYIDYFLHLRIIYLETFQMLKRKEQELAETDGSLEIDYSPEKLLLNAEIDFLRAQINQFQKHIRWYKACFTKQARIVDRDMYPALTQALQYIKDLEALT